MNEPANSPWCSWCCLIEKDDWLILLPRGAGDGRCWLFWNLSLLLSILHTATELSS